MFDQSNYTFKNNETIAKDTAPLNIPIEISKPWDITVDAVEAMKKFTIQYLI